MPVDVEAIRTLVGQWLQEAPDDAEDWLSIMVRVHLGVLRKALEHEPTLELLLDTSRELEARLAARVRPGHRHPNIARQLVQAIAREYDRDPEAFRRALLKRRGVVRVAESGRPRGKRQALIAGEANRLLALMGIAPVRPGAVRDILNSRKR